jgi:hypothetical protein
MDVLEDFDARLHGTSDVRKAIFEGTGWIPPESPTSEGLDGPGSDRTPAKTTTESSPE